MEIKMKFLNLYCKILGLSQYELTKRTGISQGRISLAKRGYFDFREDEKQKIIKVLSREIQSQFTAEQFEKLEIFLNSL